MKIQPVEWKFRGLSVRLPRWFEEDSMNEFVNAIYHHWKASLAYGISSNNDKNIFEIINWVDNPPKEYEKLASDICRWARSHTIGTAIEVLQEYLNPIMENTESFGCEIRSRHLKIVSDYMDRIDGFLPTPQQLSGNAVEEKLC